jgi:1-acyl-sn-glycerol-3-phosphate acyltransferase
MGHLRAFLFYVGAGAAAALFASLGILLLPAPFVLRYRVVTGWTRFALWWLRLTCGLSHRVSGREHIPEGPAIILCKHQSAWETMALQLVFPEQVWVFKRELLWVPFFGWGLACLDPIVINRAARHNALRQLIDQGKERLGRGIWITLFPEGTRVAPGRQGRYYAGGGLLAVEARVPVVPVAHNAGLFWPRNGFVKKPGVIDMVIGPVIDTKDKSAREVMQTAETWIEGQARRLLPIADA